MSFTHALGPVSDGDRVVLRAILGETAVRCRDHPVFGAIFSHWADQAREGHVLTCGGLSREHRRLLHGVLCAVADRGPHNVPMLGLLAAVEVWAYGEGGYRQPLPAGDGDEPGWGPMPTSVLVRMTR
jgi:hypothetical protein